MLASDRKSGNCVHIRAHTAAPNATVQATEPPQQWFGEMKRMHASIELVHALPILAEALAARHQAIGHQELEYRVCTGRGGVVCKLIQLQHCWVLVVAHHHLHGHQWFFSHCHTLLTQLCAWECLQPEGK